MIPKAQARILERQRQGVVNAVATLRAPLEATPLLPAFLHMADFRRTFLNAPGAKKRKHQQANRVAFLGFRAPAFPVESVDADAICELLDAINRDPFRRTKPVLDDEDDHQPLTVSFEVNHYPSVAWYDLVIHVNHRTPMHWHDQCLMVSAAQDSGVDPRWSILYLLERHHEVRLGEIPEVRDCRPAIAEALRTPLTAAFSALGISP